MSDPIDRNALMDAIKTIKGCLSATQIDRIVNNDIHLCDSCKHYYPSCLSGKDDVVFGDGLGYDNICACNKYQPRYDEEWRKLHYESTYSQGFLEGVRMCEQAQPEQKLGKWVDDGDPLNWVCSECGYRVFRYNNTPYCPNCGADMRGEQDDEQASTNND